MSTLTQRHPRKRAKDGAEGGVNDPDVEKNLDDADEEDRDSKETRLTLMEEILLLGLKDREVYISTLRSISHFLITPAICNFRKLKG